jgi:hypothetical protein
MELTWITTGTMYVTPLPGEASFTIEEDLRNPLTGCGSTTKITGMHIPYMEPEYGEIGYGVTGTGSCAKLTIEYIQDCPGRQCNTIITPNSLSCSSNSRVSIELW